MAEDSPTDSKQTSSETVSEHKFSKFKLWLLIGGGLLLVGAAVAGLIFKEELLSLVESNDTTDQNNQQQTTELEPQRSPHEIAENAYGMLSEQEQASFVSTYNLALSSQRNGDTARYKELMNKALADYENAGLSPYEAGQFAANLYEINQGRATEIYNQVKPDVATVDGPAMLEWADVAQIFGDTAKEQSYLSGAKSYLEGLDRTEEVQLALDSVNKRLAS